MAYSSNLFKTYMASSMALGALLTARNAYSAKVSKEKIGWLSPKSLDCYVVTWWATIAGALVGPALLPICLTRIMYKDGSNWMHHYIGDGKSSREAVRLSIM